MAGEEAIKITIDELAKSLSANNIIGQPIDMEDKIIIPVTKMGMGFGTGVSQGNKEELGRELAGGAGGGLGVFPVALVIVFKGISGPEGVQIVPLTQPSAIAESIAQITSTILTRLASQRDNSTIQEAAHVTKVKIE
jgi:uncharacterized spore protein YtfJ